MAAKESSILLEGPHDDDGRPKRKGTLSSCIAHILTTVIGSGVLSLALSIAQLGWIAGPVYLLCLAAVTHVSASLLSDCYRSPDPVTSARNYSYGDAVGVKLGRTQMWFCGFLQYLSMYGTGIADVNVMTTATSLRSIHKSARHHKDGQEGSCEYWQEVYMLIFGVTQMMMSQIHDFHNIVWLSVLAATMSFCYSFIGFGLGVAKVGENGKILGGIGGVPATNPAKKTWLVFQAMGDIAFAYPCSLILLEIQETVVIFLNCTIVITEDTLKSPPAENKTMKKASAIAILITTFFYLCCSCFGYAAFGNITPGSLSTGFKPFHRHALIDFANACVVLHLLGGYQLYSQPVFATLEKWFTNNFLNSDFVNRFYGVRIPLFPALQLNLFRLCFRTAYVISTVGIALVFPYFNSVLVVLGALKFWPLAIYFPVEMYFQQKNIEPWTRNWIVLRIFSSICFLVTVVGLIGSVQNLGSAKLAHK